MLSTGLASLTKHRLAIQEHNSESPNPAQSRSPAYLFIYMVQPHQYLWVRHNFNSLNTAISTPMRNDVIAVIKLGNIMIRKLQQQKPRSLRGFELERVSGVRTLNQQITFVSSLLKGSQDQSDE